MIRPECTQEKSSVSRQRLFFDNYECIMIALIATRPLKRNDQNCLNRKLLQISIVCFRLLSGDELKFIERIRNIWVILSGTLTENDESKRNCALDIHSSLVVACSLGKIRYRRYCAFLFTSFFVDFLSEI